MSNKKIRKTNEHTSGGRPTTNNSNLADSSFSRQTMTDDVQKRHNIKRCVKN